MKLKDKLLGEISQLRDRFLAKMDDDFNIESGLPDTMSLEGILWR